MSTVLVVSDTQAPFHHKDTLPFLEEVADSYNPNRIVHIGDEIDFYTMSHYDSDPSKFDNAPTELQKALKGLMYHLYKLFPVVESLYSNHGGRILKRANRAGIPTEFLKSYREIVAAPDGWTWQSSFSIDGVRYEHGHAQPGGAKTAISRIPFNNRKSTVFGHFHSAAGVQWHSGAEGSIFGMNVGCLMDQRSMAAAYFSGPRWMTLGCGVVVDGTPFFEPMKLTKSGKSWTGRL